MLAIIVVVASLIAAICIVNWLYRVFVSIMGADTMFFSVKTKLIWYFVVWGLVYGVVGKLLGIA